jgi:hypothetical protein
MQGSCDKPIKRPGADQKFSWPVNLKGADHVVISDQDRSVQHRKNPGDFQAPRLFCSSWRGAHRNLRKIF